MHVRKPAVAVLATVTIGLGLSACGGGGQSVADACETAEQDVRAAMGDLGSLSATDPQAATDTITTMAETLRATVRKLDNSEVEEALSALTGEFEKLQSAFADLQSVGTDSAKLQEVSTALAGISTTVQEKGEALDQLCN